MIVEWKARKEENYTDITELISKVTWGGSVEQAARQVNIDIINAPYDKNIKELNVIIATGDIIKLSEEGSLIFYGEVSNISKKGENGTVTYTADDMLKHLLNSSASYCFTNTTAEKIFKKVCGDFEIITDEVVETGVNIESLIVDDKSIYDIFMLAYTKAAKSTGKKYIPYCRGSKIGIKRAGVVIKNFELNESVNLTDSSYQETSDGVINKIIINDENGEQIDELTDDQSIKKYGIYQAVYTEEEGVNAKLAAQNMIKGIEKTVNVTSSEGNTECIAGAGITLYDYAVGLKGLFWISSDSHTWENGTHTMTLDLVYDRIMDEKTE